MPLSHVRHIVSAQKVLAIVIVVMAIIITVILMGTGSRLKTGLGSSGYRNERN